MTLPPLLPNLPIRGNETYSLSFVFFCGCPPTWTKQRATVRPVTFPLPKRQHRFLVGSAIADRILRETGCAVEVPAAESQSEDVVVRGPGRETVKAMQMVSAVPPLASRFLSCHTVDVLTRVLRE